MLIHFVYHWTWLNNWSQKLIKALVKPAPPSLIIGVLSGLTHSRADLVVENALFRQQLIVLNHQVKRSQLSDYDRYILLLLARCTKFWKQALQIVQPDTLLRWHRELFRFYWRGSRRASRANP